ncbi:MAG TPA: D-aminoacyl-tRNA deacylase [Thermoleophilaceae bacterium]
MRAVVQRVSFARVMLGPQIVTEIRAGLLVLLGVHSSDGPEQADRMAAKLEALRIFQDDEGKMNLSVRDVDGEILCVPNFTLYGDTRKGNRPAFVEAAPPEEAERLYEAVRSSLGALGGRFGEHMSVELANDGPVTLVIET